jgi:ubiquinone/menaquinone biosynthesis C-methylase UbiE
MSTCKNPIKSSYPTLDSFASLRRHHLAKRAIREEQLKIIPLNQDAHVLDIGSGPGVYLKFWLESTKAKNVRFDLLDSSEEALRYCINEAQVLGEAHRIRCLHEDLFNLRKAAPNVHYDVVFMGNTLEYVANPAQYLRESVLPLVKPGGVLVIRELDCAIMNCSGVDPALCTKVVLSRIRSCQLASQDPGRYHNPFLGRELLGIAHQIGLAQAKFFPFYCEFRAPLSEQACDYLSQLHRGWYVEDSANILSAQEVEKWRDLFDLSSGRCILKSQDLYYVESEMMMIGSPTY